jgi:SanA protein
MYQSKRRKLGCAWGLAMSALLLLGVLCLPFLLRAYTALAYADAIHSVNAAPPRPVAIIFGARVLPGGRLSTMLADRVRTGADLYHAGKVERLLMSGDNHAADYNEPEAMRRYALSLGVPPEAIELDPLGLRTYDTCYRAKNLFGIESAILVTQAFHLDRALLICDSLGIQAVGVAADYQRPYGYSPRAMGWSRWREVVATAVAFYDLLRHHSPTES